MSVSPAHRHLIRHLELTSRRQLAGLIGGNHRSKFRGQGLEFSELRPYVPGDDPRLLDWNVTARSNQPHIRCYQEERGRSILLLADLSASITPAKFDLLLETTALLAFAAIAQRDQVGLVGFAAGNELVVPPGNSSGHVHRLLGGLLEPRRQTRQTNLTPPLEAALQLIKRPGLVLLLSDFHAPLPDALLQRVAARHDCIALVLRDRREETLPRAIVNLVDAETGETTLCEGSSSLKNWQQEDRKVGVKLRDCGCDLAILAAGEPALPVLRRLFQRRRQA